MGRTAFDSRTVSHKKREEFVQFLDEMMARIHSQLTGGKEQMKVEYEKNVSAEEFREQLYSRRNKDISSGTTTAGPHRDDLRFKVGGIDIRKFGSQGQQRTAALSVKIIGDPIDRAGNRRKTNLTS